MRVTFLGQAGLYIETDHGTILCDPWFNAAFFASWFPFPSNEDVDVEAISHPDYLYVSHLHHDHFDPDFLRDRVDKDAVVLLPEYPINHLERELQGLGFQRFVKTRSAEPVELDGLRIMIMALVAPTDGPIGDSGLAVDDGRTRLFNQNDSRPVDLEPLRDFGRLDGHFLQFSGAIWYPTVDDFPTRMKQTLGRKKRQNEMARAKRYRMDIGRLLLPGSVATLEDGRCQVRHPAEDAVEAIFGDKRAYLEAYQARMLPEIERRKAGWPRGQIQRPLVETCILRHDEDWVNELFLSCRFVASREGPFNEYVYNWFKGLSPERLQYAEGWYSEQAPVQELIELDGYLVQRRCPHLKADLTQFGVVEDGVLTCRMHGWQFDLATGRCLTSDDRGLHSIPADQAAERERAEK